MVALGLEIETFFVDALIFYETVPQGFSTINSILLNSITIFKDRGKKRKTRS